MTVERTAQWTRTRKYFFSPPVRDYSGFNCITRKRSCVKTIREIVSNRGSISSHYWTGTVAGARRRVGIIMLCSIKNVSILFVIRGSLLVSKQLYCILIASRLFDNFNSVRWELFVCVPRCPFYVEESRLSLSGRKSNFSRRNRARRYCNWFEPVGY